MAAANCGDDDALPTNHARKLKPHFSTRTVLDKGHDALKKSIRSRKSAFRAALRSGVQIQDIVRTFVKVCSTFWL